MDDDAARRLLGVDPAAGPADIRSAYHRLLRTNHPDLTGGEHATRITAELNRAYALLAPSSARAEPPVPAPTDRIPDDPGRVATVAEDADASMRFVSVGQDPAAVFARLCAAADVIGDLSYVDRGNAILETVLSPETGPTCSLMITLEPRDGEVLAHCALESFDARPGPPIHDVVRALSDALGRMERS